jgi:hypothetical protein
VPGILAGNKNKPVYDETIGNGCVWGLFNNNIINPIL